jgi:hypothetical protein
MMPDFKNQICLTLESVKSQLQTGKDFFELYGYDFIISEDFRAWLIEVNTNPSLEESCQYLKQLIPRMLNDALRLTVDQTFLPKKGQAVFDTEQLN